jgi:hypothetical protein
MNCAMPEDAAAISKEEALKIAIEHFARETRPSAGHLKIFDGIPPGVDLYMMARQETGCWYVVFPTCEARTGPSTVAVICKHTGRVLYFGSNNME